MHIGGIGDQRGQAHGLLHAELVRLFDDVDQVRALNCASPSSHAGCVARIIADYVVAARYQPARILDIGGTRSGFARNAQLPAGAEVVIANPEQGVGADYNYVADTRPT